ncbi:hypothetical protein MKX07_000937 [Trichoderma sp. CBMAI-0711]|uniref:Uncharacterized protein n=1 Tax=Trichoderma parareesei TaxID=858221 RepID=A0A2H2Z9Y2_TRIPA|nr:hypothetical protein MKX07_000937 [Trichoderma sp. CBMAI-0711]OTA04069.1 hypothetical protein A9Z42_0046080 [Trichoderma parareesei]
MSSYYGFNAPAAHAAPVSHHHTSSRNRRTPRQNVSQPQRQFRGVRSMRELTDTAALSAFRTRFEAGRSFDLEDDLEFCPGLLTESDVSSPPSPVDSSPSRSLYRSDSPLQQLVSISASERSSLASNSPEASPTQQPQTVAPAFSLNSSSPPFIPPPAVQPLNVAFRLAQPTATRGRNAIPIVNPATGASMPSPPPSMSPGRLQQQPIRRW